jgi:ferritin-like metal-binding protein YciE
VAFVDPCANLKLREESRMTHAKDNFIAWLKSAHAMEEQSIAMLTAQTRRLENYPDLKARMLGHLEETRGHAADLQELLNRLSGAPSALKDIAGRIAATVHGLPVLLVSDEVVKSAADAYAFEHLEIATYRTLLTAADELGEDEASDLLERILGEEVAMASWLEENLDPIARIFLMRDERDLQAKR